MPLGTLVDLMHNGLFIPRLEAIGTCDHLFPTI